MNEVYFLYKWKLKIITYIKNLLHFTFNSRKSFLKFENSFKSYIIFNRVTSFPRSLPRDPSHRVVQILLLYHCTNSNLLIPYYPSSGLNLQTSNPKAHLAYKLFFFFGLCNVYNKKNCYRFFLKIKSCT